jgi:hypothetical protein
LQPQGPQSFAQVWQLSPSQVSQLPLPQLGQVPQSFGQVLQSSPITLSHWPLPQLPVPQPPHWFLHSPTQMSSQAV